MLAFFEKNYLNIISTDYTLRYQLAQTIYEMLTMGLDEYWNYSRLLFNGNTNSGKNISKESLIVRMQVQFWLLNGNHRCINLPAVGSAHIGMPQLKNHGKDLRVAKTEIGDVSPGPLQTYDDFYLNVAANRFRECIEPKILLHPTD